MHLAPRFVALLAVLVAVAAPAALAPVARADDGSQQIVVKLRDGLSSAQRADVRDDADATLEQRLALPGIEVLAPSDDGRQATIADLQDDPRVEWAAPNRTVTAFADPYFSLQWAILNKGQSANDNAGTADDDIDGDQAWGTATGTGATVAVVDSGAQLNHPDLVNRITASWSAAGLASATDGNGHGTHVAGIIAAERNNNAGVAGVAPDARLRIYRALNDAGTGTDSAIASAFDQAATDGAKIVNASLGATGGRAGGMSGALPATDAAIAAHPTTLFVVAAGNDGVNLDSGTTTTYPCASPRANVLCVGASDQSDGAASYSNYGSTSVDLFAPGDNIVSDYLGSNYAYLSGTSMAAPQVAGAAALALSRTPGLTTAQLKAQLLSTAEPVSAFSGRSVAGGRLNAAAVLGLTPAAVVAPAAPVALYGTPGDASATLNWPASVSTTSAYHVYLRTTAGWTLARSTPSLGATISALPNGTARTFVVTTVDAGGYESAKSSPVVVTPGAPAASPAPSTLTPPAPTPTPAATPPSTAPPEVPTPVTVRPTLGAVRLVGRPRACTRTCTPASLRFTLAASAPVSVLAARRTCSGGRCTYRATARRTLRLIAGAQRVNIAPRLADVVRLRTGTYRVTVQTTASTRTLNVTVGR